MKKRKPVSKKRSKREFRKGSKVKGSNLRSAPMRGGWRF